MPVQGLHVYQTFVIFGGGGGGDENSDDLVSVIFFKAEIICSNIIFTKRK